LGEPKRGGAKCSKTAKQGKNRKGGRTNIAKEQAGGGFEELFGRRTVG